MDYMLNMDEALRPVWNDGGYAFCETVLAAEDEDGAVKLPLYFKPTRIESVTTADLTTTYTENKDYELRDGTLYVLRGGSIPVMTRGEIYPTEKSDNAFSTVKWLGKPYILFGEGHFFHDHQLNVTYYHDDVWSGPLPVKQPQRLPIVRSKLADKQPIRALIYGDSIAAGGNASGYVGAPPYLPRFGELACAKISKAYGCPIETVNTAVGGTSTPWGLENAASLAAAHKPDLAILAFGMNDGSGNYPPEKYAANLCGIMDAILAEKSDAEFILVSSIIPNREACLFGIQEQYPEALWKLAGEHVAVSDMQPFHRELLTRKKYLDMTGNNVNHPNDYLHRVYAQVTADILV